MCGRSNRMAKRSQHFRSIAELLALLRADMSPNPLFPDLEEHEYEWLTNDGAAQLVPTLAYPFLYRLGIPADVFTARFKGFEWIGRQALPRPGEQRAWALRLPLGRDFESLSVEIFTFDHSLECGHRLAEKYDGGQALFPPDILSVLAEEIRSAPTVSRAIVNRVLTGYGLPAEMHQSEILAIEFCFQDQFGVSVAGRAVLSFSPEQLAVAEEATTALASDFKGTVRAVRADRSP